ncbi:methionine/alanine import family NSS transporter small subunit [Ornithinimicrobium flavum]|jgi:hypothetical protein|uniref:methionine/alanine import family NSS transporter small subunit n=1 Tax=Ornithinimicrobium flavum TaxID=1288636 RepID=UPI00106FB19C|nr:methionine/alanine import family NSS transporter small subunit [Ornithinimicrobium flavum]
MSTSAVVMMILALTLVWGCLIASILFLRAKPLAHDTPYEDPDLVRDDETREHLPRPMRDT